MKYNNYFSIVMSALRYFVMKYTKYFSIVVSALSSFYMKYTKYFSILMSALSSFVMKYTKYFGGAISLKYTEYCLLAWVISLASTLLRGQFSLLGMGFSTSPC